MINLIAMAMKYIIENNPKALKDFKTTYENKYAKFLKNKMKESFLFFITSGLQDPWEEDFYHCQA